MKTLVAGVTASSEEQHVGLLLSGGIDSVSVGLALREAGKSLCAYTFELRGYHSEDREKAEALARHFGWPLRVLSIPTSHVCDDFIRLAAENNCKKKVQFEVTYPLPYLFDAIEEAEVWSGFNADDHYGNTRKVILDQARLKREGRPADARKLQFDQARKEQWERLQDPMSGDTWHFAKAAAELSGKRLFDPYLNSAVFDYFRQFNHEQLSNRSKPIVRSELSAFLEGGPALAVASRLQIGGGVDKLFETLLTDSHVNRFDEVYSSVSALCLRWGREVSANRERFKCELVNIPQRPRASWRWGSSSRYRPYLMRDVYVASSAAKFTVLSTFSGGGGSSSGYQLAGGDVRFATEFVAEAARTYAKNFPKTRIYQGDIREISSSPEKLSALLSEVGLRAGDADILEGSPPCSPYSVAGKGISDESALKPYSDVMQSNIASLPFDFVQLAALARPKCVVMENVPALASARSKEVLERLLRALRFPSSEQKPRAYFAAWAVLSASDFGVPQRRKRGFIVAVRADVAAALGITTDNAILGVLPTPTNTPLTIRSALDELVQDQKDIEPWAKAAMTSSLWNLIRRLPKCPRKHTRPYDVDPYETRNYTLTRCSWDLPAPTLVVSAQRPDGMTGVIHPEQDRKFTLPELKRLFALPDDYALTGTLGQAAERVCRMVPPFLTKAIAESLYELVLNPYREMQNDRA